MTGAINLLRTQPDFARLQPASGKQIQNKDAKKIVQYLVKLKIRRNFASQSESSAVGSALRSGRRGRAFESPLSDTTEVNRLIYLGFYFVRKRTKQQSPLYTMKLQ